MKNTAEFPLAYTGIGNTVEITSFRSGTRFQEKMISMGLHVGDKIVINHQQGGSSIVISKGCEKFHLGGGLALKINVKEV